MVDYPKGFVDLGFQNQLKVIHLGLFCWNMLQSEIDAQKELDNDQLLQIWKEKGKKEGFKEQQLVIDEILSEKTALERRIHNFQKESQESMKKLEGELTKKFTVERDCILRQARLDALEELGGIKEENIRLKASQDFKSAFEFAEARYKEQLTANEELKEKIVNLTRVRSSFHLGKEGEDQLENYLKQLSDWDYINVHAEADKADFRLTNKEKFTIILDSKNFTHAVPKKDRDKLIDNVERDAGVMAGIMISLNSKISARQHCEIEYTPKNKPILYLCLQHMTNDAKLHTLDCSLKFLSKLVTTQNEKEKGELLEKIKTVSLNIGEIRKKLENCKKNAQEIIENSKLALNECKTIYDTLSMK